MTPKHKIYIANKLRNEHPELLSASDDQVLRAVQIVEAPDATPEQWDKVLMKVHPFKEPVKIPTKEILTGAAALGLGALGAAFHVRSKAKFGRAMEGVKPPEIIKEPIAVGAPAPVKVAEFAAEPKEPSAFKPSSRATHTVDPVMINTLKKIESDPMYKERLLESGGGRKVGHEETLHKALSEEPLTIDELATWPIGKAVNEVDIMRANMLRTYWHDNYLKGMFEDQLGLAEEAYQVLLKIEPGYNNMSSTSGRSLEIQKVFKVSEAVSDKIAELAAINAPYKQRKVELAKVMKEQDEAIKKIKDDTPSVMDRIENYATAAKLTSPVTHAVNSISTGLSFVHRSLEKVTSAAQYQAQGLTPEAAGTLKYAWGTGQGWVDASRKFLDDIVSNKPILEAGKTEARKPDKAGVPGFKWPFRLLVAADNFWKSIITDSELHTKAYIQASLENLSGEAMSKRIITLVENPPKSWQKEAMTVAKEYAFQEDAGKILRTLQVFQNLPGARLIIPFVQTPFNILQFYARRSVFGILSPRFYKDLNAGGARRVEAFSRLMVGLGLTGGAMALVNMGQVTGAYPENSKERSLWTLEGKRPWSIKVGNYWFQYNRFQPIGAYLSSVAAASEAFKENKFDKAENKLGKAMSNLIQGPLDLPFLQGMSSFFEFVQDPERNTKKFIQATAQGLIPNALRDIKNQLDPVQRKPETLEDAIKLMLPGLSETVPARINTLGKVQEDTTPGILKATKMIGKITETDITRMLAEVGWTPPTPETEFEFEGEETKLEGEMKQSFLMDMGRGAEYVIEKVMENPDFAALPSDIKKKLLIRLVSRVQTAVRKAYKAKADVYKRPDIQKEGANAVDMVEEILGGKDASP